MFGEWSKGFICGLRVSNFEKRIKMPFFGKREKESKKSTNLLKKDDKSSPSLEDRYELKDLLGT